MLVGILPAMTYRGGPRPLFLIRGCAQTGRANARDHSALRQGFGSESREAKQHRRTEDESLNSF